MTKITKGSRVRFIGADPYDHMVFPQYYPEDGTIGVVTLAVDPKIDNEVLVQWPKGSTSGVDEWWALRSCLEVVEDDAEALIERALKREDEYKEEEEK